MHGTVAGIGLGLLYQVVVAATSATAKHVPHRPLVRNPHITAYLVRDLVVNPSRVLVDSGGGLLRAYHWTFLGVA